MDPALTKLKKQMPPPADPNYAIIDWPTVETAVGLTYPESFKEFVAAYGGSVWFDNFSPFYCTGTSDADRKEFVKTVKNKLKPLEGNIYDENYTPLDIPLFPSEGGLFPFGIDYSSTLFCWQTKGEVPDKWPVVCWMTGETVVLENTTIAKMLLDFLEGKATMAKVWGSVQAYAPERIKIKQTAVATGTTSKAATSAPAKKSSGKKKSSE